VILQPSYIPWRGYFDLIHRADVFVFYDDVQYDRHGWRNRNRIKTQHGTQWLTIPVRSKGNRAGLMIRDAQIDNDSSWAHKHLATLRHSYASAPHFTRFLPWLERMYGSPPPLLADLTIASTIEIASTLGITTVTLSAPDAGSGITVVLAKDPSA
jgi:hypothetical protein